MPTDLWDVFNEQYLISKGKTVEQIYNSEFAHDDSYSVAEALLEFDELLQKFRTNHIFLIQRSIGMASKSLKGRPVELLENGAKHRFFPELWDIRSRMTDVWGGEYGQVRESISQCPFHA